MTNRAHSVSQCPPLINLAEAMTILAVTFPLAGTR